MSDLLVMKFGGTSMGSAARIRVAAEISAEQNAKRPVVAVVSATFAGSCCRRRGRKRRWPGCTR
jgi:aspartokinase